MDNRIDFVQPGSNHTWKKYNIGTSTKYAWEKHEAIETLLYNWNEYLARANSTTYVWKRYNQAAITKYHAWEKLPAPDRNFKYTWNQWNVANTITPGTNFHEYIKYTPLYEWGKYNATLTGQPTYCWKEEGSVQKKYSSNLVTGTWGKSGLNNAYINFHNYNFNQSQFNINDFVYIADYTGDLTSLNFLNMKRGFALDPDNPDGVYYSLDEIEYDTYGTEDLDFAQIPMTFILEDGTVLADPPTNQDYYTLYISQNGSGFNTSNYGLRFVNLIFPPSIQNTIKQQQSENNIPIYYLFELLGVWDGIDNGESILPIIMLAKNTPGSNTKKIYLSNITVNNFNRTTIGEYTYTLGSYIETVTSGSQDTYPENGWQDGYAYIKFNTIAPGDYVDTIRSKSRNYPDGAINAADGYYYSYAGEKIADQGYIVGSTTNPPDPDGTVTATYSNAYPTDGVQGLSYYKYIGRSYSGYPEWLPHEEFYQYAGTANAPTLSLTKRSSTVTSPDPVVNWAIYMGKQPPNEALLKSNVLTTQYSLIVNQDDEDTINSSSLTQKINNAIAAGYQYLYTTFDTKVIYYMPKTITATISIEVERVTSRYRKTVSVLISEAQPMFSSSSPAAHDYLPGRYLGIISNFSNSYYLDSFTSYKPTSYIDEVTSTTITTYPQNGSQGSYYYILSNDYASSWTKLSFNAKVSSFTQDYPVDGPYNGRWYTQIASTSLYTAGELLEWVYAEDPDEYPSDGYQSGYYYVRTSISTNYPSAFVDLVQDINENTYPKNGEQDGYWYVYIGRQSDILFTLDRDDILSAVKYKQDINSDGDLTIGNTACGEISFTALLNETTLGLVGKTCICYVRQADNIEYNSIGRFTISSVEKQNDHTVKVQGYDIMDNFKAGASQLMNTFSFPMTLRDVFIQTCQFFDADMDPDFINNDIIISGLDNVSEQPTGLDILGYIAEMAAGYAFVNLDNEIQISTYTQSSIALTPSNSTNILQKEYTVQAIDKLIVRTKDNEYIFGDGENPYLIEGNPFMELEDVRNAAAPEILAELSKYQYVPAEIGLIEDYGIKCGDIVLVNTKPALIMSKEISGSGIKLKCYGNSTRDPIEEKQTGSSTITTQGYEGEFNRSSSSLVSQITNNTTQASTRYSQSSSSIEMSAGESSLQVSARGVSGSYGDNSLTVNDRGVNVEGELALGSANFSSFVIMPVEGGFWIGNSNQTSGLLYNISDGVLRKYYNGQILKEW